MTKVAKEPKAVKAVKAVKNAKMKPHQKKPTPDKNDGLYKFYSSLFKQNPNSKMAATWLLERGCLSAKKIDYVCMMLEFDKLSIKSKTK
jgi:UDP-N-acetylenolpyruvoylglucosamine reductase